MDSPADVAAMIARLDDFTAPEYIDGKPTGSALDHALFDAGDMLERLSTENANLVERVKVAEGDAAALRKFVDSNMTFMDVDADWPVEGPNIPALAQVSNRIWYHATDDVTSYPFSAAIDAAIGDTKGRV